MPGHVLLTATWLSTVVLQAGALPTQASNPSPPAVTLDFFATGTDGRPISDLTPTEVTLKVAGKVRPLLGLELVAVPQTGRNILLMIDEPTLFGLEPVAKDAIAKLLGTLQPTDRIGYSNGRRGYVTPLSEKHDSVTMGLEKMVTGPGVLMSCLADMARSIEALTKWLPPGRSTTLAILSRGSPEDPSLERASGFREGYVGRDGGLSGCLPRREQLRTLADQVSASQINLQLLTIDQNTRSLGMDTLASNVSGQSALLTFANAEALARAVAQTSQYYRATFAADEKASDRPRRVELRVTRPKVKVRVSPAIFTGPKAANGGN